MLLFRTLPLFGRLWVPNGRICQPDDATRVVDAVGELSRARNLAPLLFNSVTVDEAL
jgi:hypothetical protein